MGAALRTEPPLNHAALRDALARGFDVSATAIEFVPVGYATACYSVTDDDGRRWFVKCWPPSTPGGAVDEPRLRQMLGLLVQLDATTLPGRVPVPCLSAAGDLWSVFADVPFAVFPFIDGAAPASWPHESAAFWSDAGRTVAAIHRTGLTTELPRDDLSLDPLVPTLIGALGALATGAGPDALRYLVHTRRSEIDAQMAELERLRLEGGPLIDAVLCHTDFGGDNLLIAPDGTIIVLDWDTAVLSAPEQDLRVATEADHLGAFLDAYWSAGGVRRLTFEHFEFYLRRRAMEDLTARVTRILDGGLTDDDVADALDGITRWGFDQWDLVEPRMAAVRTVLR